MSSPSHPGPDTINYDSAKPLPRTVRPASLTRLLVIYLSHPKLPRLQPSSSSPARSLHWITWRSDGCTCNAITSSSVDVLHAPCLYLLATEEHVEVFRMTVFVSVSWRAHRKINLFQAISLCNEKLQLHDSRYGTGQLPTQSSKPEIALAFNWLYTVCLFYMGNWSASCMQLYCSVEWKWLLATSFSGVRRLNRNNISVPDRWTDAAEHHAMLLAHGTLSHPSPYRLPTHSVCVH
jgi:hypothetical protein